MIRKKSQGFTLLEVLVSLVILSIGVLGLGIVQLTSLQNTQGGYLRSQATIHAYSIIDAMRANTPAVTAGNFDIAFGAVMPEAIRCYGLEVDCSTQQMASSDLNRWRTILDAQLPDSSASVGTEDLGLTTRVTINVSWRDPYSSIDGEDDGLETVALVTELPR